MEANDLNKNMNNKYVIGTQFKRSIEIRSKKNPTKKSKGLGLNGSRLVKKDYHNHEHNLAIQKHLQ